MDLLDFIYCLDLILKFFENVFSLGFFEVSNILFKEDFFNYKLDEVLYVVMKIVKFKKGKIIKLLNVFFFCNRKFSKFNCIKMKK